MQGKIQGEESMIDEDIKNLPMQENSTNPKELFDIDDIEGKSELTAEQVLLFTKLKIMAEKLNEEYNLNTLANFYNNFLTLQLSKDRGSRKEFVNAFQSKNDEQTRGLMDKFSLNLGK